MKTLFFKMFVLFALIPQIIQAQITTTSPLVLKENESAQITFDLSQTGLANYASDDVYVHAGVITNLSAFDSDWRYAPTWLDNSDKYKLVSQGNNKWTLSITPDIRSYYGVADNEQILKLMFVVRNSDGSKEAKDNGKDIVISMPEQPVKIVSTYPASPTVNAPVKITFNLKKSALENYASDDVYVHTGLITNLSTSDDDWKYATQWLENSDKFKLKSEGNNKWSLTISPDIRTYYGVPTIEQVKKMAFVVRNTDGSKEAKDNGANIFVSVADEPNADFEIATTAPSFLNQEAIGQIAFNLSQTSLAGYTLDDIYVHTGVITDKSSSDSDWKYATQWLENEDKFKLINQGNDIWSLLLSPDIRSFYGVPAGENIKKVAFIVRTSDGSKEVKDNGSDIFIPVYAAGLQVRLESPKQTQMLEKEEASNIKAIASQTANIKLYVNTTEIASSANTTTFDYTHRFQNEGTSWLIVEATDVNNSVRDSISIIVRKDVQELVLPQNARVGINYANDSTATFVLYAPGKRNVYLIGDFNNWVVDNNYMLNKDGDNWWITLSGLEKGKEYAFQYLVDGSLRIADPYTNKVLDPWNDPYIPQSVYPNLKPYPTGKTEGIVSVAQTAQTAYNWEVKDFTPIKRDKMVIYELLIRDFTNEHSFESTLKKLDYLKDLGINVVELLPVNEFEGNSSWGYNPSFYFAVDKYYGTSDAFKNFVDECHKRGMSVVIDMVLNHSFGQSPFAQLYWDKTNNKVSVDNPWYNVESPNTSYSWGSDFNHESNQTKQLVDSINSFWMSEYKVDGFRFDFTKGFTNTVGDGWAYDQSRIDILKRMAGEIYKRNPNAIVIFEHLTDIWEESALADANIMLWGNMNPNYGEAIMGYTQDNKTDLSWGMYRNRGWSKPNLIAYMESHDEERIMYKAESWGKVKDVDGALKRAELTAAFYLTQPGPKMIWQFGEYGYDYSINTCSDGETITDDCRVADKPIRWDYLEDPQRKALYEAYSKLVTAKTKYEVFESADLSYSLNGGQKYMIWKGNEFNAFIVGNFDVDDATINITLPNAGEWVDLITDESVNMASGNYSVTLKGGEYKLFIDKGATTAIVKNAISDLGIHISDDYIDYGSDKVSAMSVYTLSGLQIKKQKNTNSIQISNLPKGVYIVKIETRSGTVSQKFIK